ncbi:MAG: hypothetical protein ACF8QF_06285 [Phycisphaerales bacterium]
MARRRTGIGLIGLLGAASIATGAAAQTTWVVDDDAPGDPGAQNPLISDPAEDGTAARPFDRIQEAIDASADGDTIAVQPGLYLEFGSVDLKGRVVTLVGVGGASVTTIDMQNWNDNAMLCVTGEGADTVIDGFTLRNGAANGPAPGERGGGLYCNLSSPTVRNCIFEFNGAEIGGAVYANGGAPVFENCRFDSNTATAGGGGGALYLNNTNASFADCVFDGNLATGGAGGGVTTVGSGTAFTGCEFIGNEASGAGGAVSVSGSGGGALLFERCHFTGNTASGVGGTIVVNPIGSRIMLVQNSVLNSNTGLQGGALQIDGGQVTVRNSTLYGNMTMNGSASAIRRSAGSATVQNSIVRAAGATGTLLSGSILISHSNIEGGGAGTGNIDADPMFVDAIGGDFALTAGSACIDAGNSTVIANDVEIDFAGAARVVNDPGALATGVGVFGYFVDMGAHEWQAPAAPSGCPGDLTGDGFVNGADLGLLLGAWGGCP